MLKWRNTRRVVLPRPHSQSRQHGRTPSVSSFGSIKQILFFLIGTWFIIALFYYVFIFIRNDNSPKPPLLDADGDNKNVLNEPNVLNKPTQLKTNNNPNNAETPKKVIDNSIRFGHPNPIDMPNPCIVILTFNRPQSLLKTINSLKSIEGITSYQIYISQDGNDLGTSNMIQNTLNVKYYKDIDIQAGDIDIKYIKHEQPRNLREATEKLALHYKYMFSVIFDELNHSHAIILEDDMIFSFDFLEYFASTVYLLNNDNNLIFCISSWNDYGQNFLDHNPNILYRTDYFPGLGWLLKKSLWNEIRAIFPSDHWDHFMRLDTITKNRDCIYPDISRNYNIGEIGSTMDGSWYQQYLKPIQFDGESYIKFQEFDLTYLTIDKYENDLIDLIGNKAQYIGEWPKDKYLITKQLNNPNIRKYSNIMLIAYHGYSWEHIAEKIGVLATQRTRHKNTIIIKKNNVKYIFANIRLSPYLKYNNNAKYAFINKNPLMKIMKGNTGESCSFTCKQNNNMECLSDHFEYINRCSVLKEYFKCEEGCIGGVVGEDVPNYVTHNKPGLYHKCLTTDITPTCDAKHPTTSRLCPCA